MEERDVALQLGCSVWLCLRGICGGKLSRRAQQISSSLLRIRRISAFQSRLYFRMFMLEKPRSHSDEFLVFGFRVLTFLFVSEGTIFPLLRQLSSHAHFPFVEPPLVLSSHLRSPFGVLSAVKHPCWQYPHLVCWAAGRCAAVSNRAHLSLLTC